MFVGRASDYARYIKERNKNVEGVSKWEQTFLKPLEESYKQVTTSASQSFDYDISSAFAAYKQSMMQSEMSNLWSGEKKGVDSYLQSAYTSMFNKSLGEKYATFNKADEAYKSAIQSEEERLNKVGSQFAKFERVAYDYIRNNIDFEFDPANKEQMAKYYDISTTGDITLNDAGRDLWDRILNSTPETIDEETGEVIKGKSLESYLYETNQDMYDFYQENIQDVREMVGGLDRDDFEYSPEERKNRLDSDEVEKNIDSSKIIGELPSNFDTQGERLEYLNSLDKKLSYADAYVVSPSIRDDGTDSNNFIITMDGVEYSTNTKYAPTKFVTTSKDSSTKFVSSSRGFSAGDVFEKDGVYWYMTDNTHAKRLYKR